MQFFSKVMIVAQITGGITPVLSMPTARACVGPALNKASLQLIEEFEGFRASPYKDVGGKATVGYGHLCSKSDCSEISYSIPLSEANGQKLLQSDAKTARDCITNDTKSSVKLNANQFGALVSWAFNEGCGAARSSTLIKRLNNGESPNKVAEEELPNWNKVNGKTVAGLTRRRAAEIKLFKTATDVGALPVGC